MTRIRHTLRSKKVTVPIRLFAPMAEYFVVKGRNHGLISSAAKERLCNAIVYALWQR